MTLPEVITAALPRSPDYSNEFTARVKALAQSLAADLDVPLSHDSNMNYRAGQYVAFKARTVTVRIYLSSKAPLFAFYVLDTSGTLMEPAKASHPVPENRLPAEVLGQLDVCRKRLGQAGYTEVARTLFDAPASGCTTELDDLPATVFQSLFAEII